MAETHARELPEIGTRWTNPHLRGVWTVETVGYRYITMRASLPQLGRHRFAISMWPREWRQA